MRFSTVRSLVGWTFQIETSSMIKVQKFGEQTSPAFAGLSPMDLKAQSAMVMSKIHRLPIEERAVLWCLHVQRETEIIFLSGRTPCRFGTKTDQDLIRKWCVGEGPGCRDIATGNNVGRMTAWRYEKDVVAMLERWTNMAYATLEIQHRALLEHLDYAGK